MDSKYKVGQNSDKLNKDERVVKGNDDCLGWKKNAKKYVLGDEDVNKYKKWLSLELIKEPSDILIKL